MKLSLLVCSRNRAEALTPCLDSLLVALAQIGSADAEIVFVDNGSTDGTSEIVAAWAAQSPVPVRLLFEPRPGLSVARNCALRAAQGDLLVMTDDDCRLSPTYLAELLRYDALDEGPVLRGGRVELGNPSDLPITIKTQQTAQTWKRGQTNILKENLGDSLMGCNLTMRRKTAQALGFFDERLGAGSPIPGGEDTDYIYRAFLADVLISYVPDMTIFHDHGRRDAADGARLFRNYALGWGALSVKYLFKEPAFFRPFYWDLKNAFREILTRRNSFRPDFSFSHKDKVRFALLGAVKFLWAAR